MGGGGWETAVACLKLAMETAFETITAASTVLAIKDVVLLACSALGDLPPPPPPPPPFPFCPWV